MDDIGIMGKVAVVTGAAHGIGAAIAFAFAERGARVAALDCDRDALRSTVESIVDKGQQATGYPVDVRDSATVDQVVDEVERDLGPIGILANVAGVLRTGPILDLTDEDFAAMFAVNTYGTFYVCRSVARRMRPRRHGAIVVVGSNAGSVPRMHMGAYGASKAATSSFAKSLGLELAGSGIRCNVVSPGSTDTDMLRGMWANGSGERRTILGTPEHFRVGIPLGKLGTPSDVAEAVVFLASELAGHITMHDLCVDGGAALGA
ncbi:2,3-dihydro-2,3-dihydroxybenzoate dehydrogenase [Kibdelosporangium aridum]|uniref:2,3-dihydro-2,3-dihydroxybenzoate dehydrogenase n=1 Tax=Kibdelosporangium aridum TaxID=2030 RepID=A0A428YCC9_KIBAR|nr:2,3-dihydro-2,3-dihydroxybenzoate dehydrogenase [Kibdelosporangium aridum]RSM65247.1 2,3-dihydro-2,3-dihydroxybenzoate dehydrogenase [Kibdelosporangium aridum]